MKSTTYTLWTRNDHEGWNYQKFNSLKEAVICSLNYDSANKRITQDVEFSIEVKED